LGQTKWLRRGLGWCTALCGALCGARCVWVVFGSFTCATCPPAPFRAHQSPQRRAFADMASCSHRPLFHLVQAKLQPTACYSTVWQGRHVEQTVVCAQPSPLLHTRCVRHGQLMFGSFRGKTMAIRGSCASMKFGGSSLPDFVTWWGPKPQLDLGLSGNM